MEIIKVVLSSTLSAVALFLIAKVIGHKQMAQLDFFDYINGITIGSIAAELAAELEKPINPLIAMVVYCTITIVLTVVAGRFPKTRKYINGTPTIIMDNGKIYHKNMKKAKLDMSEFLVMCRQHGYFDLRDVKTAVFEYNGQISILPKSTARPLTPEDMKMVPNSAHILTEVVMDGRILHSNIQRMGLDIEWLQQELKVQGINSVTEIMLAVCGEERQLMVFPKA